ncbi:hypothetical protein [Nitrospira sp. Nam74]
MNEFLKELSLVPVCVLAISASELSIWDSVNHFVKELELEGYYQHIHTPDKCTKVALGPFIRASTGEKVTVTLSENRAAMCLFVAHFVLRMHKRMYEAVNANSPDGPSHVNWNFYGDKFPGPRGSNMELMFQILSCLDRQTGRILWGYFEDSDKIASDLLADNLAGALNQASKTPPKCSATMLTRKPETQGCFYWEHWT